MTLAEFMAEVTRDQTASGEVSANRMVLAVDSTETGNAASPSAYAIASVHVEDNGAALSAKTTDRNYLYEGASTLKTDTQRTFGVTGQRYLGDEFQDFACSHKIKYGKGTEVQLRYVYFNVDTGEGESGVVTIVTKKDGAAAAGNPTDIEIDLLGVGTPAEYTYTAPTPGPDPDPEEGP